MSRQSIAALAVFCLCLCAFEARAQEESQLPLPTEATEAAEAEPAGPEIVDGDLASIATQRRLGLVTVGADCSGTLLDRRWVLTADHCVGGGVSGGPGTPFANLPITAAWTTAVATPNRYVRYFNSDNLDVALVRLGNNDLGPIPETREIITSQVPNGASVRKYGRGIFGYAIDNPAPTPDDRARRDGRYRTANFTVSLSGTGLYALFANGRGQVGNGGDSGGPDFLVENGRATKIVGVQTTCAGAICAPGHGACPGNWTWVTRIRSCDSVQLFRLRQRIIETVFCNGVRGCADTTISQILLLRP